MDAGKIYDLLTNLETIESIPDDELDFLEKEGFIEHADPGLVQSMYGHFIQVDSAGKTLDHLIRNLAQSKEDILEIEEHEMTLIATAKESGFSVDNPSWKNGFFSTIGAVLRYTPHTLFEEEPGIRTTYRNTAILNINDRRYVAADMNNFLFLLLGYSNADTRYLGLLDRFDQTEQELHTAMNDLLRKRHEVDPITIEAAEARFINWSALNDSYKKKVKTVGKLVKVLSHSTQDQYQRFMSLNANSKNYSVWQDGFPYSRGLIRISEAGHDFLKAMRPYVHLLKPEI